MKKSFYLFGVIGVFFGLALFARAASIFDITYPIAELGGCASQAECKVYCDDSTHIDACIAFAEKNGFVAKEKVEQVKKMPKIGPGGCNGANECRAYCDKPENVEVCLDFAEKQGMMSKEEVAKARNIAGKTGPGGCAGVACRDYCDKPENQEVCFQFAVENNLIPSQELQRVKKIKKAVEQGGPGGCKGEKECRAFCESSDHFEECGAFGQKNGLIDEEEVKMMERGRELNKQVMETGGPGGCKSGEECHAYCEKPDHVEECLAFAVEHGGVDVNEAKDMLEKFARSSAEDMRPMGEPSSRAMMPPERGFAPPPPFEGNDFKDEDSQKQFEERFKKFEHFRELEGQFRKPPEMMQNFKGPGECKGPEECIKYCSDPEHRSECARVNPSVGASPPGETFHSKVESGSERDFRRGGATTTFFGASRPNESQENGEGEYGKESCPREYHPVCGANNRTYPNECFAKMDNVVVVKEGGCDHFSGDNGQPSEPRSFGDRQPPIGTDGAINFRSAGENFIPPAGYPAQPYPPSAGQIPGQYIPQNPQTLPSGNQIQIPPQSRKITNSLFSNLLQAFSSALRMR